MFIAQPVADAVVNLEVQALAIGGPILLTGLTALLTWAVVLFKKKLNLDDKNQATAAIESTISNGLNAGVQIAADRLAAGKPVTDVQGLISDIAHQYAAPKLNDELQRAGIDPTTLPARISARATGKMLDPQVADLLTTASQTATKRAASGA